MSSDLTFLGSLKSELAYFSGLAWLRGRWPSGAGAVLRFERVRPARAGRFQPLKSHEVTPEFLDRTIRALRRWNCDLIAVDEACERVVRLASRRRFACLTFDGGYKDVITSAYPVLSRHRAPFTVYVPTAFLDGVGEAWWLALDELIARESRVSLVIERQERHFDISAASQKHQVYDFLLAWMRSLAPSDLSVAIKDLCTRYSVDLAALSREASLDWNDLSTLAADPLVTVGSATVNYVALSNLKDSIAMREMRMGRAVVEAALQREVRHFAYPFGDCAAWARKHAVMAEQAGFVSAVSAIPGLVEAEGKTSLYELPRISLNRGRRSLRATRVILSGMALHQANPARSGWSSRPAATSN